MRPLPGSAERCSERGGKRRAGDARAAVPIIVLAFCGLVFNADARADWTVVLPEALAEDEAVTVVLADLKDAAQARGIAIEPAGEPGRATGNVIFVGSPERNASVRRMQARGALALSGVTKPDGYEIVTMPGDGGRTMVVAGGSVLGDVYGLYWLWDRLRVQGGIPTSTSGTNCLTRGSRVSSCGRRHPPGRGIALTWFSENPLRRVPWDAGWSALRTKAIAPDAGTGRVRARGASQVRGVRHGLHHHRCWRNLANAESRRSAFWAAVSDNTGGCLAMELTASARSGRRTTALGQLQDLRCHATARAATGV